MTLVLYSPAKPAAAAEPSGLPATVALTLAVAAGVTVMTSVPSLGASTPTVAAGTVALTRCNCLCCCGGCCEWSCCCCCCCCRLKLLTGADSPRDLHVLLALQCLRHSDPKVVAQLPGQKLGVFDFAVAGGSRESAMREPEVYVLHGSQAPPGQQYLRCPDPKVAALCRRGPATTPIGSATQLARPSVGLSAAVVKIGLFRCLPMGQLPRQLQMHRRGRRQRRQPSLHLPVVLPLQAPSRSPPPVQVGH
mmetsp:Transcript_42614/g.84335  ORF Transcript_42614/g.84335 Transcript_42614/m.84335 type:complete len:249 (-) Transcript_42614:1084-1830(-)